MKGNIIYIIVVSTIVVFILLMPFITIPISTSTRGYVRPMLDISKVTASVGGRVEVSMIVGDNQFVRKGDTLVVITSEHLESKRESQERLISDYKDQLIDLVSLTNDDSSNLKTSLYRKEFVAMNSKIAELKSQLILSEKELERANILLAQGVISKADFEKVFFNDDHLKQQISSIYEQQMARWLMEKNEIERKVETLRNDLKQIEIEEKNYVIKSTIDGRIVNNAGVQVGDFIVQGQNVLEISSDDNLIAECLVSPSDIGFIYIGQKVKFQMDAFNYNQWGMTEGKVIDIDQQLITTENGEMVFKVRCSIDCQFLELKNGYKGKINKGSTFTARFFLLERTLWQLLFDRVDDWFNPNLI